MKDSVPGEPVDTTPLPFEEMMVGDLVFLEPSTEPLPAMIKKYDRGSFSHVGIVVEPGIMASSRTKRLSFEPEDRLDSGGVRLNAIAELMYRNPHIGRPDMTPEERVQGATRTLELLEYGTADRSDFSFVKLFLVAAALDAVKVDPNLGQPARDAILASTAKAAALWTASEQQRLGQLQSFFCSEAICVAYPSLRFTFGDFSTFPESAEIEGLPSMSEVLCLIEGLRDSLSQRPPTAAQREALKNVVVTLIVHDPEFLKEGAIALLSFLRPHAEMEAEVLSVPGADDCLPTSLVTPRMLEPRRVTTWVRRLLPPKSAQGG